MKDEEKSKRRAIILMSLKKGYKPKVTMTAVELLVERLAKNGILHSSNIAEANELFKQQIIDSWENGYREFYDGSSTPEEYYNKTYKNTNK